jgi:immune inhibitor A
MKSNNNLPIIVLVIIAVVICCLCVVVVAAGSAIMGLRNFQTQLIAPTLVLSEPARPVPQTTKPQSPNQAPSLETPTPLPTLPLKASPGPGVPTDTLNVLKDTIVPTNDLLDLAERLGGKPNIPPTVAPPAAPLQVGDQQKFWVSNTDTDRNFQVDTTLRYVTDHLYFWIENGVRYNEADLRRLAETFENSIYPTDREFFGSEWTPGVDDDPHLYIVMAGGLGDGVAGYFSSADEYPPQAHEYSNAHEMFLLNADRQDLGASYTYGVLAHEFQHMIHWHQDHNEETWINEGFSDLAMFLNGYNVGGSDYIYAQDTDIQLNTWPVNDSTIPHYGAAYLFLNYFLNRFGEDATKAVVNNPDNGLDSIDKTLEALNITDPQTGQVIGADDVFTDWAVTNYLRNGSVGDGRYSYPNYPDSPEAALTGEFNRCPLSQDASVNQYGVDYYRITCSGSYTLRFEGSEQVQVLPADPHSGSYAFWSNRGDESDMTLTHPFDFANLSGPLNLTYWTWYDLEDGYDYLYLVASTDGGETWQILNTPSGTLDNPSGNSYGWGYTGSSGVGNSSQWVQESVDLSEFAGQQVLLRYEYVTDASVNGEGFLLDDIAIPEAGYATDFETDDGGWQAAGFARIRNELPQTFRLVLITEGNTISVQEIPLTDRNAVEIPLEQTGGVRDAVLVVSGTTRFTQQPGTYHFSVISNP